MALHVLCAIAIAAVALIGLTRGSLRALDDMLDARADDLVGAEILAERELAGRPETVPRTNRRCESHL